LPHAPDRNPPILTLKSRKKKLKLPSDPQEDADEHFATSSLRGGRRPPLVLAATEQIAAAKKENNENIARLQHFLEQTEDLSRKIRRELIHGFMRFSYAKGQIAMQRHRLQGIIVGDSCSNRSRHE
jgi:hypothetical protein